MSVLDRVFVGKTVELAVIHEPKWAWLGLFGVPKATALLAYKGILGQGYDLRFVVKNSAFMAVSYDVYSEEGAMNLHIALGTYRMALEEFRARGTLIKRLIGVALSGFQEERGPVKDEWTARIARRGKALKFVVKRSRGCFPLSWSVSEQVYSEEEATNLQNALGKYQTALEWFRSTGEVRG